jgi:two-component system, NarL family, response regulator YdfI
MHRSRGRPLKVHIIAASPNRRAELAELAARTAQAHTSTSSGIIWEQAREADVDIILVDVDTSALAEAVIRLLKKLPHGAAVVLLIDQPGLAWMKQVLRAGASGILSRELTAEEMHLAFAAAEKGLFLLQSDAADLWNATVHLSEAPPRSLERLTNREHEILRLMGEGWGNKEIAVYLKLSEHTVKFHISSILGKMNASSRTEAVSMGIKNGWIPL